MYLLINYIKQRKLKHAVRSVYALIISTQKILHLYMKILPSLQKEQRMKKDCSWVTSRTYRFPIPKTKMRSHINWIMREPRLLVPIQNISKPYCGPLPAKWLSGYSKNLAQDIGHWFSHLWPVVLKILGKMKLKSLCITWKVGGTNPRKLRRNWQMKPK